MNDNEKLFYLVLFIGLPYVISAALHFLPGWLSAPTVTLAAIFWVVCPFMLIDRNKP